MIHTLRGAGYVLSRRPMVDGRFGCGSWSDKVVVLAVVCVGASAAAEMALRRHLVALDNSAERRTAVLMYRKCPVRPWRLCRAHNIQSGWCRVLVSGQPAGMWRQWSATARRSPPDIDQRWLRRR